MASVFTWIDSSDTERRRVLDALEMFRERNTRDELGLASVRDAFSDLMFPSTGSLQRRARYFFFVPWMFQIFEVERVSSAQVARRAWQFEVKLIHALADSDDKEGVIGIQKRAALQRFPSSIYWNGLGRLRIRLFSGTQDDYYRSLDQHYQAVRHVPTDDDGHLVGRMPRTWRPGLPKVPPRFPESTSTALTPLEADYLAERIVGEAGTTVYAFFVRRMAAPSDVDFVWNHSISDELPADLGAQVSHARNFAEVMQGASILYNVLLARMPPHRGDLLGELEDLFGQWRAEVQARRADLQDWTLAEMWRLLNAAGARIRPPTMDFVEAWVALFKGANDPSELLTSQTAADLITRRERRLKGKLARITNDDARQRWNGASGLGRLEYRWRNALMVLNDILDGRRADARTA